MEKLSTDSNVIGWFVTNPMHGGKVTCHKCGGFIEEGAQKEFMNFDVEPAQVIAWFHKDCYNGYEHYYGLDKPID